MVAAKGTHPISLAMSGRSDGNSKLKDRKPPTCKTVTNYLQQNDARGRANMHLCMSSSSTMSKRVFKEEEGAPQAPATLALQTRCKECYLCRSSA